MEGPGQVGLEEEGTPGDPYITAPTVPVVYNNTYLYYITTPTFRM
jgi:hypothetical protein